MHSKQDKQTLFEATKCPVRRSLEDIISTHCCCSCGSTEMTSEENENRIGESKLKASQEHRTKDVSCSISLDHAIEQPAQYKPGSGEGSDTAGEGRRHCGEDTN